MNKVNCWLLCGLALSVAAPLSAQTAPRVIVDTQSDFLVGAVSGGKWIKSATAAPLASKNRSYAVFEGARFFGTFRGGKAESSGVPCEDTFALKLQLPPYKPTGVLARRAGPPPYLGVSGATVKQLVPRRVEELSAAPVYKEAVASWLRAKGVKNPQPGIVRIWSVDLDGDGTKEVIINAIRHMEKTGVSESMSPDSRTGDHSLLLVRRLVAGKVQTVAVSNQVYTVNKAFTAPSVLELGGVLDLNGDGKMEIIARGRYYEGSWVSVYDWRSGMPKEVLTTGCGA